MISANLANVTNKAADIVIRNLKRHTGSGEQVQQDIILDVDEVKAQKYAIALQTAWRSRCARMYVTALKNKSKCEINRRTHPEIKEDHSQVFLECEACEQLSNKGAELKQQLYYRRYQEVDRLLFFKQTKITINDSGDNWNRQFQRIMEMPEESKSDRVRKYAMLSTLNKDFVNAAKTYAQIIISEYFLHVQNKSIVAKNIGGLAGGKKYIWRGILFKMADGTSGPWNGSDEAASKAAGHDLKGTIQYFNSGVKELCFPLITLIDYKGFRMTAQAILPLNKGKSLIYGSEDAGQTVHASDEKFNNAMKKAAQYLNLRKHVVGLPGKQRELYAAVDIEGHIGMDNRYYLLDLSRSFPPESPSQTKHLSDLLADGSEVIVRIPDPNHHNEFHNTKGTVHKAYITGDKYDILFEDGSVGVGIPASHIQSKCLSVFWRLLRPEFVKYRAADLVPLSGEDIYVPDLVTSENLGGSELNRPPPIPPASGYDSFVPSTNNEAGYDGFNGSNQSEYDSFGGISDANQGYDGFEGTKVPIPQQLPVDVYGTFELQNAPTDYHQSDELNLGYGNFEEQLSNHNHSQPNAAAGLVDAYAGQAAAFLSRYDLYDASALSSINIEETSKRLSVLKPIKPIDGSTHQPTPLSPDALTAFANFDRDAVLRNQEVNRATARLIDEVLPKVAQEMSKLTANEVAKLNFSIYLHSRGINLRHMGKIRNLIPASRETIPIRTALMLQIISRTLKQIARDFQRRWMKSERSTSEQGMFIILSQFLNLIVGSHRNSETFWRNQLIVGVIQRFGKCAIDNDENNLYVLRSVPEVLKTVVRTFIKMIGIRLKDITLQLFLKDKHPNQFEFFVEDIAGMEPIVKYMHIVDYGTGVMLQELADERELRNNYPDEPYTDVKTIARLRALASDHFFGAEISMPTHSDTLERYTKLQGANPFTAGANASTCANS